MPTNRSMPMSTRFWSIFADNTAALESAIVVNDAETLFEITNELAKALVAENPQLKLNIGGRDPFRMSILFLPGAEQLANKFVGNARRSKTGRFWRDCLNMTRLNPFTSQTTTVYRWRSGTTNLMRWFCRPRTVLQQLCSRWIWSLTLIGQNHTCIMRLRKT